MFPVDPKSLLPVLLCALCASAATFNGSKYPRTFLRFPASDMEPLDLDHLYHDDDVADVTDANGTGRPTGQRLSADAVLFLTGPVSTVLMPSFYLLVCVVSVPVNAGALLAFARRIRPKKPAAIYMLNLACADLLFALLLPLRVAYHYGGNHWPFGAPLCRAVTAAFYWNMYCSALLVAAIGVDRLLAVVYPMASLAWRRPRVAAAACGAMWTLSLAGAAPLVLTEQTLRVDELNITTCHDVQPADAFARRHRVYFITLSCALFFAPLVVTAASYARVIWALSRVPRGLAGRSRRRTRAVAMAATVLAMFVLCFAPANCLLLAHYALLDDAVARSGEAPDGSYAAYLVFVCVGSLSCLLDPLLYYFGSSQCQKQLAGVLRCEKARGGVNSHSSQKSSGVTILKSSRTEGPRTNASGAPKGSLSSQYKKLLL